MRSDSCEPPATGRRIRLYKKTKRNDLIIRFNAGLSPNIDAETRIRAADPSPHPTSDHSEFWWGFILKFRTLVCWDWSFLVSFLQLRATVAADVGDLTVIISVSPDVSLVFFSSVFRAAPEGKPQRWTGAVNPGIEHQRTGGHSKSPVLFRGRRVRNEAVNLCLTPQTQLQLQIGYGCSWGTCVTLQKREDV